MAARITLSQVEDLFVQIKHQKDLKGGGPLLWGYFFTDRDAAKLRPLAKYLESTGYRVVQINPSDGTTFFLHVEKVELHTAVSLHALNTSFYGLAERFGIESYDGMDVGPAPSAAP